VRWGAGVDMKVGFGGTFLGCGRGASVIGKASRVPELSQFWLWDGVCCETWGGDNRESEQFRCLNKGGRDTGVVVGGTNCVGWAFSTGGSYTPIRALFDSYSLPSHGSMEIILAVDQWSLAGEYFPSHKIL